MASFTVIIYFVFAAAALCIQNAISQQCRQVMVCNENVLSGNKGEKGEVGFPGKAGPVGITGEAGQKGDAGEKGEACPITNLKNEVQNILTEMKLLLTPSSCRMSSVDGKQTLKSGEEVNCNEGWTVIQKRFNGNVSFSRVWNEFKNGFGNLTEEFWFGLEKIHLLTKRKGCRLRVDLWTFDGEHAFAQYSDFHVEDERDNYRVHISGYSGTAGDSMTGGHSLDGMQFSTKDRDNDVSDSNCARFGGWWFRGCSHALLNQPWGASSGTWTNIVWFDWKGNSVAMKETMMRVRCD